MHPVIQGHKPGLRLLCGCGHQLCFFSNLFFTRELHTTISHPRQPVGGELPMENIHHLWCLWACKAENRAEMKCIHTYYILDNINMTNVVLAPTRGFETHPIHKTYIKSDLRYVRNTGFERYICLYGGQCGATCNSELIEIEIPHPLFFTG